MILILIGPRGAGKSKVGARLASKLQVAFVDLDTQIKHLTSKSIAAIFTDEGERSFRLIETRVLKSLSLSGPTILATGGGVILAAENRKRLQALGKVIWLQAKPEELVRRLAGSDERPALTPLSPLDEARLLAEKRHKLYEETAEFKVDTNDKSEEVVCNELEQLWNTVQSDNLR